MPLHVLRIFLIKIALVLDVLAATYGWQNSHDITIFQFRF